MKIKVSIEESAKAFEVAEKLNAALQGNTYTVAGLAIYSLMANSQQLCEAVLNAIHSVEFVTRDAFKEALQRDNSERGLS